MDVITLLKEDHKHIAHLLSELVHTHNEDVNRRVSLFEKLEQELIMHTGYEEKLFYPALRSNPKTHQLILEAYQEHHVIGHILADISRVAFDHDVWKAKMTVMKENIAHHVKEEERDIFPKVRQLLTAEELKKMGDDLQTFKTVMRQKKRFTH